MEIKILLNKAWEKVEEDTVHTKQKLQVNDNSIFLTLITNTLDVESIYERELFFDDFEVNKIYTVYYGRNGYYPFILDSNYEMSSEDNALRFYITQDRKIVEIYCDVFTKVIDEDKYDVKYAKCENENSLWKFRHYIKFKYSEYNTNESSMSEALTLILNPNKSLSYIDAQLDIITRMLIELVELNRDKISKESLKLFDCVKDTLNNTSLLNIMSEEKLLNKFKYKEYTRSIQTEQREILKNEKKKQNEVATITEDVDMLYKAVIEIYDTYIKTQNQNFIVNIVMHNSKNCMKNLQLFAEIMQDFNTDLKINTQVQLINA